MQERRGAVADAFDVEVNGSQAFVAGDVFGRPQLLRYRRESPKTAASTLR
jgi:hypothetical protein